MRSGVDCNRRSHQLPFNTCNVGVLITYLPSLITWPTTILNPVNSFYPLDTALVIILITSYFPYIHSTPSFFLWLTWNCNGAPSLLCVYIHSFSSDLQRPLWVLKHINLVYDYSFILFVTFIRDLVFSERIFPFFIPIFVYFRTLYILSSFLQDSDIKRSPHLVPYGKVDEAIKKANR